MFCYISVLLFFFYFSWFQFCLVFLYRFFFHFYQFLCSFFFLVAVFLVWFLSVCSLSSVIATPNPWCWAGTHSKNFIILLASKLGGGPNEDPPLVWGVKWKGRLSIFQANLEEFWVITELTFLLSSVFQGALD